VVQRAGKALANATNEVKNVELQSGRQFKLVLAGLFLAAIGCLAPASASAQVDPGLRAGVSVDPDQFYVGGHLETGPLVERLVFRPNAEIGFGDDVTLVAINLEFAWKFASPRSPWNFYAGGGPAINLYQFEGPGDDTEAGVNLLAGIENRSGLFFEFKVGLADSPDFKFGVGFTFR
jgi:hypothetical protein